MKIEGSVEMDRSRGRPRDSRIDLAVLDAAIELLAEVGYQRLTIPLVAARAGTSPPSVYRRWPTKVHLIYDAVFPSSNEDQLPTGPDLRAGLRAMLLTAVRFLNQPGARVAMPGLLAEFSNDPELHAAILQRSVGGEWRWLHEAIARRIGDGQVRPDVRAQTVIDIISGTAFMATVVGPPERVDNQWVDELIGILIRGIASDHGAAI
jgi:AcrR family transcriptional regulator